MHQCCVGTVVIDLQICSLVGMHVHDMIPQLLFRIFRCVAIRFPWLRHSLSYSSPPRVTLLQKTLNDSSTMTNESIAPARRLVDIACVAISRALLVILGYAYGYEEASTGGLQHTSTGVVVSRTVRIGASVCGTSSRIAMLHWCRIWDLDRGDMSLHRWRIRRMFHLRQARQ